MTKNDRDDESADTSGVRYDFTPPTPKRTIDQRDDTRQPTPEAAARIRALVNPTGSAGEAVPGSLQQPDMGETFSQRQLARKVLAGRSYQAVQAWLNGEPVPKTTADWLLEDLRWVDNRAEDRVIRLAEDEIAIVVRR